MNDTLTYTISEMYRLAHQYVDDVARFRFKNARDVFRYVANIPYVGDLQSCGVEECLKRPAFGNVEGDCDDKAIFSGAALTLLRVPWRFVTVSYHPDRQMRHVYLEVFYAGSWKPFDATYAHNKIFTEKPFTSKITWDNPMMTRRNGITTLEGVDSQAWVDFGKKVGTTAGVDFTSIIKDGKNVIAGVAVTVGAMFGPVGAVAGVVLGFIAQLIGVRGKTQHMSPVEAEKICFDYVRPYTELYEKLPDEGKRVMDALGEAWLTKSAIYIWPWTGNTRARIQNQWHNNSDSARYGKRRWERIIFGTAFDFLTGGDLEHIGNDWNRLYMAEFNIAFVNPLKAFIQDKLKSSMEEIMNSSGSTSLATVFSNPGVLVGGAVALALLMGGSKR